LKILTNHYVYLTKHQLKLPHYNLTVLTQQKQECHDNNNNNFNSNSDENFADIEMKIMEVEQQKEKFIKMLFSTLLTCIGKIDSSECIYAECTCILQVLLDLLKYKGDILVGSNKKDNIRENNNNINLMMIKIN
jgi:hypothetical protein